MVITFDSETSSKTTFSESCHHNLSNDILFVWFRGGQNFPTVFSNYVIVTLEVRFLKISFCFPVGLNCAKFHWASLNGSWDHGGEGGAPTPGPVNCKKPRLSRVKRNCKTWAILASFTFLGVLAKSVTWMIVCLK